MAIAQRYAKRLIEVDLPIKRISAHARREKAIHHGHISTAYLVGAAAIGSVSGCDLRGIMARPCG
jgi:hypothetical protein